MAVVCGTLRRCLMRNPTPLRFTLHQRTPITLSPTRLRQICSTITTASSHSSQSQDPEPELSLHQWKPVRKKKVVMRIGYVGTDYRGLQMQRDDHSISTIEKEFETAIFKAGGIRDSNFGDLDKISWRRSSRTDKGVHSLATTISFKMEIPENAWKDDDNGIALANYVNHYLPKNIRIFCILPAQRTFDPRQECNMRKYSYLVPAEIIGIKSHSSAAEIENHISDFNNILNVFEGDHPFHNYTVRSNYRRKLFKKHLPSNGSVSTTEGSSASKPEGTEEAIALDNEKATQAPSLASEYDENLEDTCGEHGSDLEERSSNSEVYARWLHEPDEDDKITGAHFRKILHCTCGRLMKSHGFGYVEIFIWGESFMLHQIRKMVGTAVAVKRKLLPRDILTLSLSKFSRIILPIAPPDVLILKENRFAFRTKPGKETRDGMVTIVESEEILEGVDKFYNSVMLPQVTQFLDPSKPPWKVWVEKLDEGVNIPDAQLDDVRKGLKLWKDGCESRTRTTVLSAGNI